MPLKADRRFVISAKRVLLSTANRLEYFNADVTFGILFDVYKE